MKGWGRDFKTVAQRASERFKQRRETPASTLQYGIGFLDKTLNSIKPVELILIGAEPGAGKTQLAKQIALHNAMKEKRVHFFALEAHHGEIEDRMVYEIMAKLYFGDQFRPKLSRPLNYMDWIDDKFEGKLESYEIKATEALQSFTNLSTYYKTTTDFTVENLIENVTAIADETDLVIIDHLHFFDYDAKNENAALKEIAKTASQIVQLNQKPIVLIAHLRKSLKQFAELIPSLQEFHGSSDVGKIATTAITLGKGERISSTQFETYVRIAKARYGGERTRYIGKMIFDVELGGYTEDMAVGELSNDGKEFLPCEPGKEPFWLR